MYQNQRNQPTKLDNSNPDSEPDCANVDGQTKFDDNYNDDQQYCDSAYPQPNCGFYKVRSETIEYYPNSYPSKNMSCANTGTVSIKEISPETLQNIAKHFGATATDSDKPVSITTIRTALIPTPKMGLGTPSTPIISTGIASNSMSYPAATNATANTAMSFDNSITIGVTENKETTVANFTLPSCLPPNLTFEQYATLYSSYQQYLAKNFNMQQSQQSYEPAPKRLMLEAATKQTEQRDGAAVEDVSDKRPPPERKTESELVRCESCKLTLTGKQSYEIHLSGARHKKTLLELKLRSRISLVENPGIKMSGQGFYCEICKIQVNSALVLNQHIKGAKHRENVKEQPSFGFGTNYKTKERTNPAFGKNTQNQFSFQDSNFGTSYSTPRNNNYNQMRQFPSSDYAPPSGPRNMGHFSLNNSAPRSQNYNQMGQSAPQNFNQRGNSTNNNSAPRSQNYNQMGQSAPQNFNQRGNSTNNNSAVAPSKSKMRNEKNLTDKQAKRLQEMLFCPLCVAFCQNKDALDMHMKSKKHLKKVAQKYEMAKEFPDSIYENVDYSFDQETEFEEPEYRNVPSLMNKSWDVPPVMNENVNMSPLMNIPRVMNKNWNVPPLMNKNWNVPPSTNKNWNAAAPSMNRNVNVPLPTNRNVNVPPSMNRNVNVPPTINKNSNLPPSLSKYWNLATPPMNKQANVSTPMNKNANVPPSMNKQANVSLTMNKNVNVSSSMNNNVNVPPSMNKQANVSSSMNKNVNVPPSMNKNTNVTSSKKKKWDVPPSTNKNANVKSFFPSSTITNVNVPTSLINNAQSSNRRIGMSQKPSLSDYFVKAGETPIIKDPFDHSVQPNPIPNLHYLCKKQFTALGQVLQSIVNGSVDWSPYAGDNYELNKTFSQYIDIPFQSIPDKAVHNVLEIILCTMLMAGCGLLFDPKNVAEEVYYLTKNRKGKLVTIESFQFLLRRKLYRYFDIQLHLGSPPLNPDYIAKLIDSNELMIISYKANPDFTPFVPQVGYQQSGNNEDGQYHVGIIVGFVGSANQQPGGDINVIIRHASSPYPLECSYFGLVRANQMLPSGEVTQLWMSSGRWRVSGYEHSGNLTESSYSASIAPNGKNNHFGNAYMVVRKQWPTFKLLPEDEMLFRMMDELVAVEREQKRIRMEKNIPKAADMADKRRSGMMKKKQTTFPKKK